MKLTRLLACGLSAFALISTLDSPRADAQQHAAVAANSISDAGLFARRPQTQSSSRRRRPARRATASALLLHVVQEINADGLRKILQRDASAPRPLLINFWATWCGPCREEFPDLVRIGEDYKTRKLDFVIVSLDDPSEIKTGVPRFLRQMRANLSAYLLNENEPDAAINAVDPEWAGSMPATFLLDAAGQLVYKHLGPINPEELRAELEKVTEKQ
jgi:thiol-disulfide isomerase/thioredoxin